VQGVLINIAFRILAKITEHVIQLKTLICAHVLMDIPEMNVKRPHALRNHVKMRETARLLWRISLVTVKMVLPGRFATKESAFKQGVRITQAASLTIMKKSAIVLKDFLD